MSSLAAAGAAYKLNAAGEELLSPLLEVGERVESDDEEENEKDEDIEKRGPLDKLKTTAVYGVLVAGVTASALAFVFAPQTLVFVAGGICMANVPYSAYKEYHLSRIPTLRSLNNALRADTNNLSDAVDTLSEEIDVLQPEADRAALVEEQLQGVADKQHFNVDRLLALVKENGEIIDAMQVNLCKQVVQDIIRIVVSADKDNSMTITKSESKLLALQIGIQLKEYKVEFDEEQFLKLVSLNPSVPHIINLVKRLAPNIVAKEEEEEEDVMPEEMDCLYGMCTFDSGVGSERGNRRQSLMAPTRSDSKRSKLMKRSSVHRKGKDHSLRTSTLSDVSVL